MEWQRSERYYKFTIVTRLMNIPQADILHSYIIYPWCCLPLVVGDKLLNSRGLDKILVCWRDKSQLFSAWSDNLFILLSEICNLSIIDRSRLLSFIDQSHSVQFFYAYDALGDIAFVWVSRRANFEIQHFTLKPCFTQWFALIYT